MPPSDNVVSPPKLDESSIQKHSSLIEFLNAPESDREAMAQHLSNRYSVIINQSSIDVTPTEICILLRKIEHLKIVLSREQDASQRAARQSTENALKVLAQLFDQPSDEPTEHGPLRWASQTGQIEAMQLLLTYPAYREKLTDNNNQFLRYAVIFTQVALFELLMTYDEVLTALKKDTTLAILNTAAHYGRFNFVQYLVKIPEVYQHLRTNLSPLNLAIGSNWSDIARYLLNLQPIKDNITLHNNLVFRTTCEVGDLELFEQLLLMPAVVEHIAINDCAALKQAVDNKRDTIVFRLLSYPSVHAYASQSANLKIAAYLTRFNAMQHTDTDSLTPIARF